MNDNDLNTIILRGDAEMAKIAVIVGFGLLVGLFGVWLGKPPRGHKNWASTSFSTAVIAVVVLFVCMGLLLYTYNTGQLVGAFGP